MRELVLLGSLFFVYQQVRFVTRDDVGSAMSNARRVIGFERALGVFRERDLQTLVLHSEHLVSFLNRYYVTVHFPASVAFLVWVLVRHHDWYRAIRTWFVVVTGAALTIHVAFPLAPPRMITSEGLVDTLRVFGPSIYPADTSRSVANQLAAMPSLHFGWALMVAVGFVAIKRSRRSLLALAHPAVTLLAIVATANHYWLDAAVAGLLVCAAAPVLWRYRTRDAMSTEPVELDGSQPASVLLPC